MTKNNGKGAALAAAVEHLREHDHMVLPVDKWQALHDELFAYQAERKRPAEMKMLNLVHMPGSPQGSPPHRFPEQPMPYFLLKNCPVFVEARS
jgi:hypothetical protein